MTKQPTILIVDDERNTREGLQRALQDRYNVLLAEDSQKAVQTLESTPVTGTTKDWVRIEVPALTVPKEHIDYLVWIDLVLDGKGVGWLTDVDVDQQQVWDDVSVPVGPRKPVPAG